MSRFDLVLVDIAMPEINGVEAVQAILEEAARASVPLYDRAMSVPRNSTLPSTAL